MKNLLFLVIFFFSALIADDFNASDTVDINTTEQNSSKVVYSQKVLYLSYKNVPKRVLKGEIFPLTIKTLSTVKNFTDINYTFSNSRGLKLLDTTPFRESYEKYYYDTFYFLTTQNNAKLPDITAFITREGNITYQPTTLKAQTLNSIILNPKKDFSNIVANFFEVTHYKTSSYDEQHNIIVFMAEAQNCDIKALSFNDVFKQGIESIEGDFFNASITYYMVINKNIEDFSFSYFNLKENRYIQLNIPIVVNDDSVATQSDLKPKDQSKEKLKMFIAAGVAFIGFIFILWRKRYIYLIFILIPLAYILYIAMPSKELCIKKGSEIHLLPVDNGTIFEKTRGVIHLQKEGRVKGFFKVKLQNEKIGWVRDEDICSY